MKKTIVICGPTATGKTEKAIQIAQALQSEIISADSQLVYKGLNIGTAKPTLSDMQGVKHHLIDIVAPNFSFSIADYVQRAEPIVKHLEQQNKHPILCGGTGFYINAILFQRSLGSAPSDANLRAKYQELAKCKGNSYLYDKLKEIDAETAEKLHVNDIHRIIRAIEIFELTGKKKSAQNENLIAKREYIAIAFKYDREVLYDKINKRVLNMMQLGLIDEVQELLKQGLTSDMQSMQAIGYKEVICYLNNTIGYNDMVELIQQKSRNYAKRQITFFKKLPNLQWIEPNTDILKKVEELL